MKLLLVDDQPLFIEGLQNLLAAHGLDVAGTASDGMEALEQARALRPDVILMDIQMPRCDGLEATRLIKAEMPEVKIVMLTASGEEEALQEALKCGASGYLLKSLDAGEFFQLLSGLTQRDTTHTREDASNPLKEAIRSSLSNSNAGDSRKVGTAHPLSKQATTTRGFTLEEMPIYQEIVDNALAATGAIITVLSLYDHDTLRTHFVAWSGLNSGVVHKALTSLRGIFHGFDPTRISMKVDANQLSWTCYKEGTPVLASLEEMAENVVDLRIVSLGEGLTGIRYALLYPLMVDGRVEGSLTFLRSAMGSSAEQHTCEAFARLAALTLENASLAEALQKQLKEVRRSKQQIITADERLRRDIAELLHGRVQTKLLVSWHRLGECQRLMDTDPAQARTLLETIREEIDGIREHEVRQASHLLHPSIIRVGLIPAVRSAAGSFTDSFEVSVQVDPLLSRMDNPLKNALSDSLRLTAYRAVEEALSNVYRHAGASRVELSLGIKERKWLTISVEDNGRGFDTELIKPGLGLDSIAGRVDQAGGSWEIESAPGEGTRLSVLLPLVDTP